VVKCCTKEILCTHRR